jgi:hypothetical protein
MSSEHDAVITALIQSATAPGAVAKLADLGMSPEAAQQIIRHLSHIPAFRRNLTERLDGGPTPDVAALEAKRLVFLHIPKCGGTTLHDMLVDWYGAENMHPERHNGLYFYSARDLASKTLFSGHYDYYATQLVPGRRRVITFLRDPRSRLISLYNFHRSHRDDLIERFNLTLARWANLYDIDAYFANPQVRAHPAINNSITRHLSNQPQLGRASGNVEAGGKAVEVLREQAMKNLEKCDFVGLMEEYVTSIQRLADLLGKPVPQTIGRARDFDTLIATDPNMKKIDKQQASAETHALMDDLVREDEAVYRHARKLFKKS